MSYGKYGMKIKTPYYDVTMSPQYNLGLAIGDALGSLWGANYNRRGIEKGTKKAQAVADQYPNGGLPQSQPAPDELYVKGQQANAYGLDGKGGYKPNKMMQDTAEGNREVAEKAGGLKPLSFQPRDLQAEKLDYLVDKYSRGTPNPDGDAIKIDALSTAGKANLQNMDLSKLPNYSQADLEANIRRELQKDGRTEYQINQILENMKPTITAKVQEGQNKVFDQMYDVLNNQIKNGELDNAQMTFARMGELNPTRAKALEPKMKRAWGRFDTQENFNNKVKFLMQNDPGLTEQEAKNLALYQNIYTPKQRAEMGYSIGGSGGRSRSYGGSGGGRSSGSGRTASVFNDPDYKGFVAQAKSLQEQLSNFDDSMYPSPEAARAARASLMNDLEWYQAAAKEMLAERGYGASNIPASDGGGQQQSTSNQNNVPAETAKHERPLSDAAEIKRQNEYNRQQGVLAAQRAGLYINPYTNTVMPASPWSTPTQEQMAAFREWQKHFGQ